MTTKSFLAIYVHEFLYANFIKHNRHFMSTYFLLDPFEFPYYFYRIRGELIYVLSIYIYIYIYIYVSVCVCVCVCVCMHNYIQGVVIVA